ncbi:MAG: hypothetical protein LBE92_20935 [Chryseobacterium sp.]|jgi:hypothetical protein|uniref:hypothetical protein n=1 Tax=Chryseobacterium sp. TaxID=1871047 RepID=UPI002816F9AF|nr:hypothetical protein [Chryseobacterium sp.]MDR2238603.1 hypothetical protein [Chryseobacterium sp.]
MIYYFIKNSQSLSDVCHELHIENVEYLKEYHNQHCAVSERIQDDIHQGLKLYIPSSEEIREINRKIRADNRSFYDFPHDGKFPFDFRLWEGTYQITHTVYSQGQVLTKYHHKIRLHFEGMSNNDYEFLFSVFDFSKNGTSSDTKTDTLAQMCMDVIYPVKYKVSADGTVNEISLTRKQEEMIHELDAIKSFFPDVSSSGYIEHMKSLIKSPETISQKFKNTLLNAFMFGPVYRAGLVKWNASETYNVFYPWIFDAHPIRFELQNILLPKNSLEDQWLRIHEKGVASDHRSLEDLYFPDPGYDSHAEINDSSIDCEHSAEYTFKRDNYSLYSIEAVFQYFGNEISEREDFLLQRIQENDYI